jgi:hypothetical protein
MSLQVEGLCILFPKVEKWKLQCLVLFMLCKGSWDSVAGRVTRLWALWSGVWIFWQGQSCHFQKSCDKFWGFIHVYKHKCTILWWLLYWLFNQLNI